MGTHTVATLSDPLLASAASIPGPSGSFSSIPPSPSTVTPPGSWSPSPSPSPYPFASGHHQAPSMLPFAGHLRHSRSASLPRFASPIPQTPQAAVAGPSTAPGSLFAGRSSSSHSSPGLLYQPSHSDTTYTIDLGSDRAPRRHLVRVPSIGPVWNEARQARLDSLLVQLTASANFPLSWIENPVWHIVCDEFIPQATVPTRRQLTS